MYTGSRLHIHVMKSHKSQPFVQNKVIHFSRNALYGTYYTLRDVSEMDPGSTVRESEMTFHQSDISSERTRVREPTGALRAQRLQVSSAGAAPSAAPMRALKCARETPHARTTT